MDKTYQFRPDSELVSFADWFADHYRQLPPDRYKSLHGEYVIEYTREEMNTIWAMYYPNTNEIKFSEAILSSDTLYTAELIFYLVLWCQCFIEMEQKHHSTPANMIVDNTVLQYYRSTGKSLKLLYSGFKHMAETYPFLLNQQRYKLLKSS